MAHVREVERKIGRAYEVRWRDGGKFRQRSFTVKREAERFALTVENQKAHGQTTEPLAGRSKSFEEVVQASLAASRAKLKPSTYAGYVQLYEARVLPTFGKRRISTITSEEVEAWVADLIASGRASSTVRNHFIALNKVFRYALRHRLIAHNPCDAVDIPRATNAEGFAPVFLTAAQVEQLAKELDEFAPYGLLIRFAAGTGLRAAELQGLRIRDVNLAAGHVEVRQSIRRVNGEWQVGTPKSARSTRNVPLLSRSLIADLREYLLAHPHSGDADALFWPARSNGSRRLDWSRNIDCGGVRAYYLVPAAQRAGVVQHMRFHDLRHTYASLMLAAGFKPYEVSRWMGHASVSTTDTIYGHLYPTDYVSQINRFESWLSADA
ncbi:Site-specific recombinase XerD [Curtobacterium sp. 9128]|uniref:tyrosine-type recombinase/integrase n=1 Tax=Curtobacterium sp. 9128 TaxID=1793722 RepID=UPI0007D72D8A|nr:site-specific integrase [Curtobacterium sp. 9128]SBN62773.1 Site-specific recombinase XerD [Curtobacterium sp. 9128]